MIQVEDENDNKPQIPTGELVMCEKEGEHSSVLVVAEDKDMHPNSFDFSFALTPDDEDTWSLQYVNGRWLCCMHLNHID